MGKLRRGKEPPPDLDSSSSEDESSTQNGEDEEDYASSTGDWETESDSDDSTQMEAGSSAEHVDTAVASSSVQAANMTAEGANISAGTASTASFTTSVPSWGLQAGLDSETAAAVAAAVTSTEAASSSSSSAAAVMEAMLAVLDSGATGPSQSDWFMAPAPPASEAPAWTGAASALSAVPFVFTGAVSRTEASEPAVPNASASSTSEHPSPQAVLTYWERYEASQLLLRQQNAQRRQCGLAPLTQSISSEAAATMAAARARSRAASIVSLTVPVPAAAMAVAAAAQLTVIPVVMTYWERHQAAQLLLRQQQALAQEGVPASFTQSQRDTMQEQILVLSRLLQGLPLTRRDLRATLPVPHSPPFTCSNNDSSALPSNTIPNTISAPTHNTPVRASAHVAAVQNASGQEAQLPGLPTATASGQPGASHLGPMQLTPTATVPHPQAASPFSRLMAGLGLWRRSSSNPGTPAPPVPPISAVVHGSTAASVPHTSTAAHASAAAARDTAAHFSATIASVMHLQGHTSATASSDLASVQSPPSSHELMQLALRLNSLTSHVMHAATSAATPQADGFLNTDHPAVMNGNSFNFLLGPDQSRTGAAAGTSTALLRPLTHGMLHLVGECLQALQSVVLVNVGAPSTEPQQQNHARATVATVAAAQVGLQAGNCRSHSVSDLRDWSWTSSGGNSDEEERGSGALQQQGLGGAAAGSRSCSNLAVASLAQSTPVALPPHAANRPIQPLLQRLVAAVTQRSATEPPSSVGSSTVVVSSMGADPLSQVSSDEDSSSSDDSSSADDDSSSEEEDSSDDEDEVVVGAGASHAARVSPPLQVVNPFSMMTTQESSDESSDEDSDEDSEDDESSEEERSEFEESEELEDAYLMSSDEDSADEDINDNDDEEDEDDEDEYDVEDDYEAGQRALDAYNSEANMQSLMMGAMPGLNMAGHGGHGNGGFSFGAGFGDVPAPPHSATRALQEAAYAHARAYSMAGMGHWNGPHGMLQQPGMLPTFNMPLGSRPVIVVMRSNADGSDVAYLDPESDSDDSVPDLLCPCCTAADEESERAAGAAGSSTDASAAAAAPATTSCHSDQKEEDSGDEEGDQCWLCFCDGPVESLVPGSPSTAAAGGAAASTAAAAGAAGASSSKSGCQRCWGSGGRARGSGRAGAVVENMDALMDPCGVCMGGMKYIHRSCFDRYLSTTWSLSCPNCARPYTLPALQSCSTGRMLLSLAASASPDQIQAASSNTSAMHTHWVTPAAPVSLPALVEPSLLALRQQYPAGAMACVQLGRVAQLLITCEGTTPLELLKVVRSLLDGFVTEPLIASTATGQTIELRGAHTITSITIAIQPAPTGAEHIQRMGYPHQALAPLLEQILRQAGPVARDLTSSLLTGTGEAATLGGYERTLALIRTLFAAHTNNHGGAAGALGGAGGGRGPLDLDLELLSLLGSQAGGAMGMGLGGAMMMGAGGQQQQPGPLIVLQEGADGMAVQAAVAPRRPRAPAVAQAVLDQQRVQASSSSQQERHAQRSATQVSHQRQSGGGSGGSAPRQRYHAGGGGQGRRH